MCVCACVGFCCCCFCFFLAVAAVVGQQGVWGADGHRATVSQSLVHGASLPQLRSLLCRFTGHDQGEGTTSSCISACDIALFVSKLTFFGVRLLPGVLWHLAGADGGAGTVFRPRHSWRQGTLPSFSATSAAAAAAAAPCSVDINTF